MVQDQPTDVKEGQEQVPRETGQDVEQKTVKDKADEQKLIQDGKEEQKQNQDEKEEEKTADDNKDEQQDKPVKIGIIGAGVSGIVALRQSLLTYGDNCEVHVFDRQGEVGGMWNNPLSAIFPDLRTNTPACLLNLDGLDFVVKEENGVYPSQQEVGSYLKKYVSTFQLENRIRLRHEVELVEPVEDHGYGHQWRISGRNLDNQGSFESVVDLVLVCSGKEEVERKPVTPNMNVYAGNTFHSKEYLDNKDERIAEKSVLIYGLASSGIEIMEDIKRSASMVFLSGCRHGIELTSSYDYGENVIRKGDIVEMGEKWVRFYGEKDLIHVDTIIWCTGYKKTYPFLSSVAEVTSSEDFHVVNGLYKQTVCMKYPTLAVINITDFTAPWVQAEVQTRYFLKLHKEGRIPDFKEMKENEETYLRWMKSVGAPLRKRDCCIGVNFFVWPGFIKDLCKEAGLPIPKAQLSAYTYNIILITQYGFKQIRNHKFSIENGKLRFQRTTWKPWILFKIFQNLRLRCFPKFFYWF